MALREIKRKGDVRNVADRVEEITETQNDKAVCAALSWAARTKAGPSAALDACITLGIDMRGALKRARLNGAVA